MKLSTSISLLSLACATLVAPHAKADQSSANPNWVFNFSQPMPSYTWTDPQNFDDAVLHEMNYSISENDPRLNSLRNKEDKAETCFPVALAEALTYFFHYAAQPFSNLALPGLSSDKTTLDPVPLVQDLTTRCQTDLENGTNVVNGMNCIGEILRNSGYGIGTSTVVSPDYKAGVPLQQRAVDVADIQQGVHNGEVILMEIGWYRFDPVQTAFVRAGGHFIGVYGFDSKTEWGDSEIILKVINPALHYANTGGFVEFDNVTMRKIHPYSWVKVPQTSGFELIGNGFKGNRKALVERIIRFKPAVL